jgi:hypothetical protein
MQNATDGAEHEARSMAGLGLSDQNSTQATAQREGLTSIPPCFFVLVLCKMLQAGASEMPQDDVRK